MDDHGLVVHGEADDVTPPLPTGERTLPARLVEHADLDIGGTRVLEGLLAGDVFFAERVDLFAGLKRRIGVAGLDERFDIRVVEVFALGLEVGADGAGVGADGVSTPPVPGGIFIKTRRGPAGYPEKRTIVPLDAEPCEVFEDAAGGLVGGTGLVGVLNADHEATAPPTTAGLAATREVLKLSALGEGPAEERGACAADVQVAGGAGGEAGDDGAVRRVRQMRHGTKG